MPLSGQVKPIGGGGIVESGETARRGFELVADLRVGLRGQAVLIQAESDVMGNRSPDSALQLFSRKTPGGRVTTILRADDEAARDIVAPASDAAAGVTRGQAVAALVDQLTGQRGGVVRVGSVAGTSTPGPVGVRFTIEATSSLPRMLFRAIADGKA